MTFNPQIDDFIRLHRERLTREAITQQLEGAGHARVDIDAAWERLVRDEPLGGRPSGKLSTYVWVVYWLGAILLAAWTTVSGFLASGLGVGWLALYLLIAYFPTRALARARASSMITGLAVVVAAPILVIVVGAGICIATIAVFAGLMS